MAIITITEQKSSRLIRSLVGALAQQYDLASQNTYLGMQYVGPF
jgi:hypothetical protein